MGRERFQRAVRDCALAGACGCVLLVLASPAAVADEVYGRVTVRGSAPAPGAALEFRRQGSAGGTVAVGVDATGGYRVFLEPGRYEVRLTRPEATRPLGVTSLPAPIRQDLVFP